MGKWQCSSIITFVYGLKYIQDRFSFFFGLRKRRFTNTVAEHLLDLLPVSVQAWIQPLFTIKVKFPAAAVLEICSSFIFPLVPGMK